MSVSLQQQAKIYLSDMRGKQELDGFRSYHNFNFGSYRQNDRSPFGNLYVLNDDTLAGGSSFQLKAEQDSQVLLLPIVGTVCCNNNDVIAGELLSLHLAAGDDLHIRNPYSKRSDLVNFLQFWFRSDAGLQDAPLVSAFSFEERPDGLITLSADHYPPLSIGKFRGRKKGVYEPKDLSAGIYVFVVQGAFEVEDRLLHARDGLSLTGFDHVSFEALSNDAILVLTEVAQ